MAAGAGAGNAYTWTSAAAHPSPNSAVAAVVKNAAAVTGQTTRNLPAPPQQPDLPDEGLYFTINERPRSVVRVMDDVALSFQAALATRRGKHWWVCLLFPAGLPFILADQLVGLPPSHLSLGAYALWTAGFLLTVTQRRASARAAAGAAGSARKPGRAALIALASGGLGTVALLGFWDDLHWVAALIAVLIWTCGSYLLARVKFPTENPFGIRFETARTLFATLADDLAPKRTLVGWLDLTGPRRSKLVRSTKNARGRKTDYVRDEWLRLKIPLYDGSVLRVSVLEHIKKHHGYTKRGRSGKYKFKSGREQSTHVVKLALTVDPAAVEVARIEARRAGGYRVEVSEARDGRVVLRGRARKEPSPRALLDVIAYALQHTRRRSTQALGGRS